FSQLPEDEQTDEARKKPYRLMGRLLRDQDRDIVLNLCQYGMANVWEWGKETGHSWRVGGDLGHTLTQGGLYTIAEKNIGIRDYNGPGGWNDPDYLIMGMWKTPYDKGGPLHPVELSPNEYYSYMSLWCLMACPLFFSGDMDHVDDFTRNILCNTEMIAVNQDPLGVCAEPVFINEEEWVLKKVLQDGSVVVGFFNLSKSEDRQVRADWGQLEFCCPQTVRDLWRQMDLGDPVDNAFTVTLGPRGCAVLQFTGE
ncbi:MAG: alpha-galactosidase, partial [Verrucomicrobiae bacterium]|nr:alpha-galactosidase [Verrucomicrobiae bacterium]